MRIFGSDRISGLMQRLGMEEGVPIEHKMVTNAIARAQKQVEAQNFSVRKHLLEYDDVMNKQRESVYALRRELLEGKIHLTEEEAVDTREYLLTLAQELLEGTVERYAGQQVDRRSATSTRCRRRSRRSTASSPPSSTAIELESTVGRRDHRRAVGAVLKKYESKEALIPVEILRRVERDIMLQIVDAQWKDHLYSLDHLKEGIGLRGYGQRDPLVEYKKESFALFQAMKDRIEEEIVRYLWRLTPVVGNEAGPAAAPPVRPPAPRRPPQMTLNSPSASAVFTVRRHSVPVNPTPGAGTVRSPPRTGGDDVIKQVKRDEPKVGRNDPCPCGSGKKYKKCHGAA